LLRTGEFVAREVGRQSARTSGPACCHAGEGTAAGDAADLEAPRINSVQTEFWSLIVHFTSGT
jgi:hypothetical protein